MHSHCAWCRQDYFIYFSCKGTVRCELKTLLMKFIGLLNVPRSNWIQFVATFLEMCAHILVCSHFSVNSKGGVKKLATLLQFLPPRTFEDLGTITTAANSALGSHTHGTEKHQKLVGQVQHQNREASANAVLEETSKFVLDHLLSGCNSQ